MAESLKQKTVKGLGWSALDDADRYGMQFVIGIVLARLLSPDDYGLLGIVGIVTVVCTALVNGGFTTALIHGQRIFRQVYPCKLLGDIAAADGNGGRRLHGVMPADKKPGIHRDENYACAISKKGEW